LLRWVYLMSYNYTTSMEKPTKINQLLRLQPAGVVLQANWLDRRGYSYGLQQRYRESRWLESIGTGAMIRAGDEVSFEGGIYALQQQSGLNIHPAGRTALVLLGKTHYLEMNSKRITLFGGSGEKLPKWFENYDWGVKVEYHQASMLPKEAGLTEIEIKSFSIQVSDAIRAVMECLYLAADKESLMESYELMENLNNLRPDRVQSLLEACRSVKVKRLFLYLAEKAGHNWFKYLNLEKIDTGSGKRSFIKQGVYVDKYQITVPKELETNDHDSL
jgi:Transcriptional regulator, AbiEi antitoxin, Type IV TA system/Transcriptional regulator, AbiEi antitoxin N-terminal domain